MRIGYARTTIDRSTRTSVVISFGLVGRARSQSSCHRMDRVFVAEFEVAGSSFVGRSLADSRHATLLLFLCRGRDVSCVDFVSIIHPDYRPEPIRAAILYSARLLRSDGGEPARIWPTPLLTRVFLERIGTQHCDVISLDRGLSIIFDRSSRQSRNHYLSFSKLFLKAYREPRQKYDQQKVSFEKLISRPTISAILSIFSRYRILDRNIIACMDTIIVNREKKIEIPVNLVRY